MRLDKAVISMCGFDALMFVLGELLTFDLSAVALGSLAEDEKLSARFKVFSPLSSGGSL